MHGGLEDLPKFELVALEIDPVEIAAYPDDFQQDADCARALSMGLSVEKGRHSPVQMTFTISDRA